MFLTRREPGVPLSLFRPYLFPFLLLFFYIVPYPSFSSMSFSLIYICCSFRGGILSVVFRHCSHMFLTRREPGVPLSLFRPYPLPFSPPFLLYFFLTIPSLFSYVVFPTVAFSDPQGTWSAIPFCCPGEALPFWPAGNLECPCLFSDLSSSFSMSFSLIYICCSFRGGILSVVFPTVAICFWPAGNLECPCLFSDLILFPFLLLSLNIVPYPSFSSMSFSLIYICCSFRGGILSVVFRHCSHMFLTRREPGVPLSLFRSYPLPFSPPFLLYCYLPFLFFYVFFIDLYLL